MKDIPSRREELIAGALAGDLRGAEWLEYEQARAEDPTIDTELGELRETSARLNAAQLTWREVSLPMGLEESIRAAISEDSSNHQEEQKSAQR